MLKNILLAGYIVALGLFEVVAGSGCGGISDMGDEDLHPMQVTTTTNADGTESASEELLPIDYGMLEQAITFVPPDRFGNRSDPDVNFDGRCPSGGFPQSSVHYCEVPGTTHINWGTNGIDARFDSTAGITMRPYVIQGAAVAAQDAAPTGFQHELDNSLRSYNGAIRWSDDCNTSEGLAFACLIRVLGPVTIQGGQRIRVTTGSGFRVNITSKLATSIQPATQQQKAFEIINIVHHELGHAEGNGHVPSAEDGFDPMNLINSATNQVVKHLTPSEVSRMTEWNASH